MDFAIHRLWFVLVAVLTLGSHNLTVGLCSHCHSFFLVECSKSADSDCSCGCKCPCGSPDQDCDNEESDKDQDNDTILAIELDTFDIGKGTEIPAPIFQPLDFQSACEPTDFPAAQPFVSLKGDYLDSLRRTPKGLGSLLIRYSIALI